MEQLIARLDRDRDYGERTHEQIEEAIRDGSVLASELPDVVIPRLQDAKTGRTVKGTATTAHPGSNAASQKLHHHLVKLVAEDGGAELAVNTLKELMAGGKDSHGNVIPPKTRLDAVDLLFMRVLGVPERNTTPNENAALIALMEQMAQGQLNERRSIPEAPQYGAREIEVEVEVVEDE